MTEKLQTLIQRALQNPKTSALGIGAAGLIGAGETMQKYAIEPWGTIVCGLGAAVAAIALFWVKDEKPA